MTKPSPRKRRRGSIRAHGNGFEVRVYAGLDPLTKQRIYLTEHAATPADAERVRVRLLAQVDEQRAPRGDATINELIDKWWETAELEDSTRNRYSDILRLRIRPTFGEMKVRRVTSEALELYYGRLRVCSKQCGGRRNGKKDSETGERHVCVPLKPNTVRKDHFVLAAVFNRAVRWGYVTVSPAALAEAPAFQVPDPDPPTAGEAAKLLNTAWGRDLDWGTMLFLVMVTGCRRGELCGLRWGDVDFAGGVLSVAFATDEQKNLKRTKSMQRRRIAFDTVTGALLQAHLERCRTRSRALGGELPDDAFVFSDDPDGGEPLRKQSVSQRYRRLALKLGLRSTRLHSTRHFSATELIAAGVDLRTVSGRLGHGSGGATTLRMYAAWVPEADKRAASTIAGMLPGPETAVLPEPAPWERITAELRASIADGAMPPGTEFPTVADLAATYEVSIGTAHRAFAQLKKEGLLDASRSRRAVVANASPDAASTGRT